jgi:hypothetical protein
MKIKMNTSFAGEWSCNAGDIVERPDAEARRLIEAGYAVAVREAAPVQTATRAPILEKAIK